MDEILPNALKKNASDSTNGCTTVCCNTPGNVSISTSFKFVF